MKMRLYILLSALLASFSAQGQAVVWPGDANNNGIANHVDVLYVGLGQGQTGPPRNTITTVWAGYPTQNWGQQTQGGVNFAHLDCNGDGTSNNADFFAIKNNYNDLTGQPITPDTGTTVTGNAPSLSLVIPQDTAVLNGSTLVNMDIVVGTPVMGVDSIYGIAFVITFDTSIVDSIFTDLPGGFINNDSTAKSLAYVDYQNGRVELAITRTNHTNAVGSGAIGTIGIVMDDNIRTSSSIGVNFGISYIFALTASETPVYLSSIGDSLEVVTNRLSPFAPNFIVYPNPFDEAFVLRGSSQIQSLRLLDQYGRLVWREDHIHRSQLTVRPGPLPSGAYILEVHSRNGITRKKLVSRSLLR